MMNIRVLALRTCCLVLFSLFCIVISPLFFSIMQQSKPNTGQYSNSRYVVLSCKIPVGLMDDCLFKLPLTVRVWRRVHYKSVVIFTGNVTALKTQPVMKFVHQQVKDLGAKIVLLEATPQNVVMINQVARLVAAALLEWDNPDEVFLLTSDVDLWPINKDFYEVPPGKKIMILNSGCCGSFMREDVKCTMYPTCNIGMTAKLWIKIMRMNTYLIKTSADIRMYLKTEFGKLLDPTMSKGVRSEWFVNKYLLSMRMTQWKLVHGEFYISFKPRNIKTDRLEQSTWHVPGNLNGIIDAHLIQNLSNTIGWEKTLPLIRRLFSESDIQAIEYYKKKYNELLRKWYREYTQIFQFWSIRWCV